MNENEDSREDTAIPHQPVVFECVDDGCALSHEFDTDDWDEVTTLMEYYVEQGHLAQARFPRYNNVRWPTKPEPTGELPWCTQD